jgi:hypothetical protein
MPESSQKFSFSVPQFESLRLRNSVVEECCRRIWKQQFDDGQRIEPLQVDFFSVLESTSISDVACTRQRPRWVMEPASFSSASAFNTFVA